MFLTVMQVKMTLKFTNYKALCQQMYSPMSGKNNLSNGTKIRPNLVWKSAQELENTTREGIGGGTDNRPFQLELMSLIPVLIFVGCSLSCSKLSKFPTILLVFRKTLCFLWFWSVYHVGMSVWVLIKTVIKNRNHLYLHKMED